MKLILALIFFVNSFLFSQWQSDVRLTIDTASSSTSEDHRNCITVNGNFVLIVWRDYRDGNDEIYYKRSPDNGISWGSDTRLTNNSAESYNPTITSSGNYVYILWVDLRDGNPEIYLKRSTDDGLTWLADTRLTNDPASSYTPSISASGSIVHVNWRDDREGNPEMFYKRSPDNGISWGSDTRLTNNTLISQSPTIAVSGLYLHTAWVDNRDGNWEIYYKQSTDEGISWGTDTRLTFSLSESFLPSLSISGSLVHLVWIDKRDNNYEVYYKRSPDNGLSWSSDTRLTNDTAVSDYASVISSDSAVHVLWQDFRNSNFEIYYKRSISNGLNWESEFRLTNNPLVSIYPSGSVSGQNVLAVWSDNRDGNYEIYFKRNPTGNPIGIQIISSEIPTGFILSQNYPNPFNPSTTIEYSLSKQSDVLVKLYDVLGQEVKTLIDDKKEIGTYKIEFDGSGLSSGTYFYQITLDGLADTKKMVLVK